MSRSVDLRERALSAWEGGMATREVLATFGVARSTLYRWKEQHQQQGHLRPGASPGGSRRITTEQDAALLAQVQAHPDAYLREHVVLWQQQSGQQVSLSTMRRAVLRLNQTLKKRVCEP